MPLRTSPLAIEMIKRHEGVRSKPYRCPAGLWTVGVGHLLYPAQARLPMAERLDYPLAPDDQRALTHEEVDQLLSHDLQRFERGVARWCPASVTVPSQFDALVSFAFNLGLGALQRSTLRQKYNRGEVRAAGNEFLRWTRAGGRILPGLVKRRREERALFLRMVGD